MLDLWKAKALLSKRARALLVLTAFSAQAAGFAVAGEASVIDVKSLGAAGDGVHDDSFAFQEALKKAAGIHGPVVISVPDGVYRLNVPEGSDSKAHLAISGMEDLSIEGERLALLVMGSPYRHGIGVFNSKNIVLKKLAVDYDPLPFTQGSIIAVSPSERTIDVRIDEGFPLPGERHMDAFSGIPCKSVGYTFDPANGKKLNQFYDQYVRKPVEELGDGVYRYKSSNEVAKEMEGKRFAVVGRRSVDAVKIDGSTNCVLQGLEVYSAPACGYNVSGSSGVALDRCVIKQKPGTARLMSSNADGLHSKWCPVGPELSNSYFTGMGDDAVNIGGTYVPVIAQLDERVLIVGNHGSLLNYPNDIVCLDLETQAHFPLGPTEDVRNVRQVDGYDKPCLRVAFKNKLPKMLTWKDCGNAHQCSQILNLNACGRGAKVVNNRFYNHRARGVLMRAPEGLIKGNLFDSIAGPGVVVSNDCGFLTEGPSGNGTVIEGNVFTRIERSNIWISSSLANDTAAAICGVVDLKISGNRFEGYGGENAHGRGAVGNVLYITNASRLTIEGNFIGKPLDATRRAAPVLLKNDGSIIWRDNLIEGRSLEPETDFQTLGN